MSESTHGFRHHLSLIADEAISEAVRATDKHGTLKNFHEAYAVLLEEVDELWKEIKQKNASSETIYEESLQVASVALRIALMAKRQGE